MKTIIAIGLTAVSLAAVPATASARTYGHDNPIVVRPGQSIQAAIDAAPDRATIIVRPGVYAENLYITKPIHVAGDHATLTLPAAPQPNPCSSSSPEDRLPGICVLGELGPVVPETTPTVLNYVADVQITGMRITGYPGNGVIGYGTERLLLANDELDHNGFDGAISLASHHTVYLANHAHDNGVFGLTVEDSAHASALIIGNEVEANNGVGLLVRDADVAMISGNHVEGNCGGVFVLQTDLDEATGDVMVARNTVRANNRFCEANADGYPSFAGIGIAIVGGVTNTTIRSNTVTGHRGTNSADLPAAGVLVLDTTALGGAAPTGNSIIGNTVVRNSPVDVLVATDAPNTVTPNRCGSSFPDGLC